MPTEKQIMQKSIETMEPGKEEGHITLMDHLKKTWICLGCNRSFLDHYEIVNHMDSENHLVMVNSDFGQIKGIAQAEIKNMLTHLLRN
jgi:hypothetical protein